MTERERLIEVLSNIDYACDNGSNLQDRIEFIADYLLANEVIVLPVKVGDVVYYVFNNTIIEYQVASIVIFRYSQRIFVLGRSQYFEPSDFGETVFLTREEAKTALKGGAEE